MERYRITGLPIGIAEEARLTRRSPGYGHPVHQDLATGTGPWRSCLGPFDVGAEDRLLFTYRPDSGAHAVGAPGPIFIHADECARYDGSSLPADLRKLPLVAEGRTNDGRTLRSKPTAGRDAERAIDECLGDRRVDFVMLRHGQAGCFIARVDRA